MKILVAPLDWGLGHTSRCMPIIDYLLSLHHEVIVAANGASAQLIKAQFSNIRILPLEGYGINYSSRKSTFSLKILSQIPRIMKAIQAENKWLAKQMSVHHFDMVISDNRYGLYHSDTHCVFMTHQLHIKTGNHFTDTILQKINYSFINKFDECWIVDSKDKNKNLAGTLSHPKQFPKIKSTYIGHLSQLSILKESALSEITNLPKSYILALLSGPEPMRTILESRLIEQMRILPQYNFVLAAGKPIPNNISDKKYDNIIYVDYLNTSGVYHYVQNATIVICRSGYSTIMDLVLMQKPAILIPTPGQTEQEYLAAHLTDKHCFLKQKQSSLDIAKAIAAFQNTSERNNMTLHFHQTFQRTINESIGKIIS